MASEIFRDQHALLEYVEEHDLAYAWEGMSSFSRRLRMLEPGQYEIVEGADQARHYSCSAVPEGNLAR